MKYLNSLVISWRDMLSLELVGSGNAFDYVIDCLISLRLELLYEKNECLFDGCANILAEM